MCSKRGQEGPRERQDGQVRAKTEPTWLQDAKDVSTLADIVPILKKPRFPLVFVDFRRYSMDFEMIFMFFFLS